MREKCAVSITILALLLACGCSKKPDDAVLVSSIQSQMFADDQLKNTSVHVESHSGTVTLTGTVTTDSAHLEAYKLATQTPGVVKVDDQITVAPPPPPAPAP